MFLIYSLPIEEQRTKSIERDKNKKIQQDLKAVIEKCRYLKGSTHAIGMLVEELQRDDESTW